MTALRLSYVVQTDTWATLSGIVDSLARQTAANRVELVVVASGPLGPPPEATIPIGGVMVVEHPLLPLAAARATGIEASSGEIVAIGETHVFPARTWAEEVIAAHDAGADVVLPAVVNANPRTRLSWSSFLLDYGRYRRADAALQTVPTYNATFRRACLPTAGALVRALEPGPALDAQTRGRGARVVAGRAALAHLNADRPRHWLRERFLTGMLIGAARRAQWQRARCVAYAAGSPAIAAVLFTRALGAPRTGAPRGTLGVVALACVVSAAGEASGYLGAARDGQRRRMASYELHKSRFVRDVR